MVCLLSCGIDVVSAAAGIVPLWALLWRTKYRGWKWWEAVGSLVFALYLAAVFSVVGLPGVGQVDFRPDVNLLPVVSAIPAPKTAVLNVLLFLPLGFLVPILFPEYRHWKHILCLGFFLSLGIELSQLFTLRLTDVDDLICNSLGALLGRALATLILRKPRPLDFPRSCVTVWIFVSAGVCLLLQPVLSNWLWELVLKSPLWAAIR